MKKIYEEGFEFDHTFMISPLCMNASGWPHQKRYRIMQERDAERIAFEISLLNVKEKLSADILKKKLFCEMAFYIPSFQNALRSCFHTAEPYITNISSFFIDGLIQVMLEGGKNLVGFSVVKFSINAIQGKDTEACVKFNLFPVEERMIQKINPAKECKKDKYSCLKFECDKHGEENEL
jgi:hypothetical protein